MAFHPVPRLNDDLETVLEEYVAYQQKRGLSRGPANQNRNYIRTVWPLGVHSLADLRLLPDESKTQRNYINRVQSAYRWWEEFLTSEHPNGIEAV